MSYKIEPKLCKNFQVPIKLFSVWDPTEPWCIQFNEKHPNCTIYCPLLKVKDE